MAPASLVLERLLVQNFIAVPSPVWRRDAWLACGGLDLDLWYTADWDIWLKLARHGPAVIHFNALGSCRCIGGTDLFIAQVGHADLGGAAALAQVIVSGIHGEAVEPGFEDLKAAELSEG